MITRTATQLLVSALGDITTAMLVLEKPELTKAEMQSLLAFCKYAKVPSVKDRDDAVKKLEAILAAEEEQTS